MAGAAAEMESAGEGAVADGAAAGVAGALHSEFSKSAHAGLLHEHSTVGTAARGVADMKGGVAAGAGDDARKRAGGRRRTTRDRGIDDLSTAAARQLLHSRIHATKARSIVAGKLAAMSSARQFLVTGRIALEMAHSRAADSPTHVLLASHLRLT